MLRALMFVLVTVISIKASAKSDGAFACFRSANQINRGDLLGHDGKFGIHFLTDFSFDVLTDNHVSTCELLKLSSEHHGGPPFRVQLLVAGQPHYFLYARAGISEVGMVSVQDSKFYPKPNCSPANAAMTLNTWEKAIHLELNKAQEMCDSDEQGQTGQRTCYNRFQATLKVCAKARQPTIRDHAQGRLRELEAHINFKDSSVPDEGLAPDAGT